MKICNQYLLFLSQTLYFALIDTRIKLFRNNHMISVVNLNVIYHFRRASQISRLLAAIMGVCKNRRLQSGYIDYRRYPPQYRERCG